MLHCIPESAVVAAGAGVVVDFLVVIVIVAADKYNYNHQSLVQQTFT